MPTEQHPLTLPRDGPILVCKQHLYSRLGMLPPALQDQLMLAAVRRLPHPRNDFKSTTRCKTCRCCCTAGSTCSRSWAGCRQRCGTKSCWRRCGACRSWRASSARCAAWRLFPQSLGSCGRPAPSTTPGALSYGGAAGVNRPFCSVCGLTYASTASWVVRPLSALDTTPGVQPSCQLLFWICTF